LGHVVRCVDDRLIVDPRPMLAGARQHVAGVTDYQRSAVDFDHAEEQGLAIGPGHAGTSLGVASLGEAARVSVAIRSSTETSVARFFGSSRCEIAKLGQYRIRWDLMWTPSIVLSVWRSSSRASTVSNGG